MDNYLYHKYKGKYRVLPHYDTETNDFPRDEQGNITTKVRVGDTIEYVITVENTGKVTVKDITVTDELVGLNQVIEKIEVGNKEEITVTYTVKEADIENEQVVNVATAGDETV